MNYPGRGIDRLGHNYKEIQNQRRVLTKGKGIDIVVLDMPPAGHPTRQGSGGHFSQRHSVLQALSFVAENVRANIRQRQAEGIAAAKKRGIRFGRPYVQPLDDFPKIVAAWKNGRLSTRLNGVHEVSDSIPSISVE